MVIKFLIGAWLPNLGKGRSKGRGLSGAKTDRAVARTPKQASAQESGGGKPPHSQINRPSDIGVSEARAGTRARSGSGCGALVRQSKDWRSRGWLAGEPFDPALRDLRMNRAAARFTSRRTPRWACNIGRREVRSCRGCVPSAGCGCGGFLASGLLTLLWSGCFKCWAWGK